MLLPAVLGKWAETPAVAPAPARRTVAVGSSEGPAEAPPPALKHKVQPQSDWFTAPGYERAGEGPRNTCHPSYPSKTCLLFKNLEKNQNTRKK